MRKFIIQDWAGNVLQHDGKFNFNAMDDGVPMEFDSFDDGWDWIVNNIDDEDSYQDLYVEEREVQS